MVIVVFGLPGSGKSYFARKLAEEMGATYLNTDLLRNELPQKKDYSFSGRKLIYETMIESGKQSWQSGHQVVLDGTFYRKRLRDLLTEQFDEEDLLFIEVIAPEALHKKRTQADRPDSDADYQVYKQLKSEFEPLEQPHLILTSTENNIEAMVHEALDYVGQKSET